MLVNIGLEHKILSYTREGYIINVGEYWPEHKVLSYTRESYIINVGEYWPEHKVLSYWSEQILQIQEQN